MNEGYDWWWLLIILGMLALVILFLLILGFALLVKEKINKPGNYSKNIKVGHISNDSHDFVGEQETREERIGQYGEDIVTYHLMLLADRLGGCELVNNVIIPYGK